MNENIIDAEYEIKEYPKEKRIMGFETDETFMDKSFGRKVESVMYTPAAILALVVISCIGLVIGLFIFAPILIFFASILGGMIYLLHIINQSKK